MKFYVENKFSLEYVNNDGNTILSSGIWRLLLYILVSVQFYWTLHIALESTNHELKGYLIENSSNINIYATNKNGLTMLEKGVFS